MKKAFKSAVFFAVIISVFLTFISCSKNTDSSSSDDASAESGKIDFAPQGDISDGRKNIYAILKVNSGDYWESIIKGITDAGSENNCNIYIGGVKTEAEWELQEELLNEACDKKADAIIFAPANSSKFEKITNRIHSENIPLILIDTILTAGYYDVCYMTDNLQAGQLAAQEMISLLREKGYTDDDKVTVAIQTTTKESQTIVDRIAGFNKYWYKNVSDKWKILDDIKFNLGNSDIAVQNGKDFISEHPDINVLAAFNNSSAVGFAKAITETGHNDIILSAFDYSKEVAALIADESMAAATVVQKQYDMGYKGIISALDIINGKDVGYKFVDTGVMVINERNYREYESGNQ